VSLRSLLPIPPRSRYTKQDLPADLSAAVAVCFLAVPQGLAYATIAGLPPVMGLYAAAVPTIIGSLFRSSRHVIAGPTNALSLLVGAAVATGLGGDPVGVALTLALMVGAMQVAAGVLRLGSVVNYISGPVVLGYITGAGVLIGAGQLYNVTATEGPRGSLLTTLSGWLPTVNDAAGLSVAVAVGTVALVIFIRILSRRLGRRIPAAIVAMVAALVANMAFGLEDQGLAVISDLSPIPGGFAMPAIPELADVRVLVPLAIACTVLSLVESSAVARSIASRTGQRLDPSTEFVGQGLSNLVAGFWGGYPVSGSLSRSALNETGGARTRVSGIITGTMMIGVLLAFGPLLDHTPISSLAGLLLVVAWDLVDRPRVIQTLRASVADAMAFGVTLIATWTLSLDTAIYLGVGVSLLLFLRSARVLSVHEMVIDARGSWQERSLASTESEGQLTGIRVLQAEGPLFFGAAGDLMSSLDDVMRDEQAKVVVLRLKRAQGMDITVATALAENATIAKKQGKELILVGLSSKMLAVMRRSGAAEAFPAEHLIEAGERRFEALNLACERARSLVADAR